MRLSSSAESLLKELLLAEKEGRSVQKLLEERVKADESDSIARGIVGELKDKKCISVLWADNIPFVVELTYTGRTYFEFKDDDEYKDYRESVPKRKICDSFPFSEDLNPNEFSESLGCGGFGVVYKWCHNLLDFDFAVKVFEPIFVSNEENTEAEKRFLREAKFLFQLNHENIVRVYDIGRWEEKPYIKMEYVNGSTLEDCIKKEGPMSFDRSKRIITALMEGLSYAHKTGIIHRDLKPNNVMVTESGQLKIIDFGVSAYLENEKHSKLTKTGESIAGGPYADPVLRDNPQLKDCRSDIYSVGAIWYFLLAGRAPAGSDIREILLASNNASKLEGELVMKCIASDLEGRFQTCDELLSILQPPATNIRLGISASSNRLTEITREAIFDYLLDRYSEEMSIPFYQSGCDVFKYSGRRDDVVFLGRLYDLQNIPSTNPRFSSFEGEIWQHTINNSDYEYGWVFEDDRLNLKVGNDEILLNFLCEMFHPAVRSEKSAWEEVLAEINKLVKADGYEIYESNKISGRSVYSYRYCF